MPPKSKSSIVTVLLILLVASVGFNYYLYSQSVGVVKNPQEVAQKEAADLVAKVSKLIVLPEGENPTVATVKDPEKLKDQLFFANAKEGSKVLIFTKAKKAVLYDPDANKVIEVAPLNIGNPSDADVVESSDES